ncbi:MAG TPA: antibiotic ABC transporter ATP-binding protein [Bacteroidales bacterium]|nr:antibiotic ABC transporter ATP-binding protein [Bacteroidales bacterium]
MRDALRIFRRFLPPYKKLIGLNILFNILGALFGAFSIVSMIPILKILLKRSAETYSYQEASFSLFPLNIPTDALKNNLYYYVTDLAATQGPQKTLMLVGGILIVMTLLKTGFTFFASYTMVIIRNNVVRDIRNKMYRKIVALHLGFFSDEKKGDIIARSTGDVAEVEFSVMQSLDMFIKNPIIIVIMVTSMVIISWQLTLFIFILLPIAGTIIGYIGRTLKRSSMKAQNKMGEILSTIDETISGLRIVKGFNGEAYMKEKQGQQNDDYRKIANSIMTRHASASPTSELLGTLVFVLLMWYGGKLILGNDESIDFEEFIAYLGFFFMIINPAKAFSTAFYSIQKGLAAMSRIDMILKADVAIKDKPNAIENIQLKENILYKNVSFRYADEYVLINIDLAVQKGKTVALVGQSGSGKSTMVDLLPRFYDIEEGEICIDENNVKDIKLHDLRSVMGIVNQDPILFNDTIFNNIAFGKDNATEQDVVAAAKIANAHEFIMQTPEGYQTNIGDRGSKLSGGQRQRISIARAILKNPPILILDEATSALDTESERLVQDALTKLMANRTSIVIAHRLSTIVHADNIVVLREGEIVEQGKHDELMKKRGEYYKFHQLQNYKEE